MTLHAPNAQRFIHCLTLILLLSLHPPIKAQTTSNSPNPSTPSTSFTELENDPITIDSIGLTLNLPLGSQAETVRIGNSTSTGVSFPKNLGTLIIKEQRTSNDDLTYIKAAQSIRDQLLAAPGMTVIGEEPNLRVGIWPGYRFYVRSTPNTTNARTGSPSNFRGVTVFGHKSHAFLIFDFTFSGSDTQFQQAKVLYETSIATMNLQEMSSQALKRVAGFNSTNALLDQLSIEDYDAVLTGKNNARWDRLYTPAKSGDEMDAKEHGYRRIRSWSGYKGELGTKDKAKWNTEDRKLGYLVQIDSMAIEGPLRIESRAFFFMTLDGNEEIWTIRMTLKDSSQSEFDDEPTQQDSAITGARIGGKLTITSADGKTPPKTISPFIPENGYITQVQSYLITALIAHKQLQGDFASYAYNPMTNSVTLRWDISEQPSHSPDMWSITSKTSPDSPPSVTLYNAHGDLMRVRLTAGRQWEPIKLDRLLDLWKRKGLPLE